MAAEHRAKYVGASDAQVQWGDNCDPRGLLELGTEYAIERTEQHAWHTKIFLQDFPGKAFNSVCFEID